VILCAAVHPNRERRETQAGFWPSAASKLLYPFAYRRHATSSETSLKVLRERSKTK